MFIAIVGPDGCGKTTVANALVYRFKEKNIVAYHHAMHFQVLPKLKDFINPFLRNKLVSGHEEGEYHAGMKAKPNSILRGSVYVCWYAIDYFLGRFKLSKSLKRGEVIVFARYYLDYYFQRGHINTPHLFIKFCELLVPTPTLIITIDRKAEDIYSLKPELSINEIKRQQGIIENLFTKRSNAFIVDGTGGIDNTVDEIMHLIDTYK